MSITKDLLFDAVLDAAHQPGRLPEPKNLKSPEVAYLAMHDIRDVEQRAILDILLDMAHGLAWHLALKKHYRKFSWGDGMVEYSDGAYRWTRNAIRRHVPKLNRKNQLIFGTLMRRYFSECKNLY